ncbi:Short-chain dehydrogenase TIC 32 [Lasiodiplodia hormozganensis]|uniref:Short-chain dehydrogenase TIC 32 n=1 Tax=Lasiodiplodia hormozganensis TaxID=869390 RepID=A0AA39XVX9_9PEZI|nr:Short-chain dehydrogenase TIC 32 [Lasiodiplodia hormozganensis]
MAPPYGFETTATEVAADLSANIRGKTVLITGVTPNSLGSHFATTIAQHSPALLILASRTQASLDATTAAIHAQHPSLPIRTVPVDLSSLASARAAAATVVAMQRAGTVIDALVLNAGVMACPYSTTSDGFELQFGTCHLGHFVFANAIVPGMLGPGRTPRVVVVSSEAHQLGPVRFTDPGFGDGKEYDKWRAYGQAKTANCLYAWSLAEKLGARGLQAYSLHPGSIVTNLGKHIDMQGDDVTKMCEIYRSVGSPPGFPEHMEKLKFKNHDQGTATHVVAAFSDDLKEQNGQYLVDCKIASWDMVSPWARNSFDAERLWKMSEDMVGEKFEF